MAVADKQIKGKDEDVIMMMIIMEIVLWLGEEKNS
jgi:hypothetical protein